MATQLNITVPTKIARRFKAEVSKNNRTLDGVGTIILQDFFDSWSLEERRKFYAAAPLKRTGRKVNA